MLQDLPEWQPFINLLHRLTQYSQEPATCHPYLNWMNRLSEAQFMQFVGPFTKSNSDARGLLTTLCAGFQVSINRVDVKDQQQFIKYIRGIMRKLIESKRVQR